MSNWNDGGVPHGCRKVKFYAPSGEDASGNTLWPTDKGVYILENFAPSRPQYVQGRYDELRNPNGQMGLDDFEEGSAVAQLSTYATDPVARGWAFKSVSRGAAGTNEAWVVTSAEDAEAQGEIRKQSIRLRKLVVATGPSLYPAT